MTEHETITPSTGNILEDLGLPDADDRLAKAELTRQIGAIIREHGLTQKAAARVLGVDQPNVSALLAGQERMGAQSGPCPLVLSRLCLSSRWRSSQATTSTAESRYRYTVLLAT